MSSKLSLPHADFTQALEKISSIRTFDLKKQGKTDNKMKQIFQLFLMFLLSLWFIQQRSIGEMANLAN